MRERFLELIGDEGGQDLAEYAFLTVFVALVGALAFPFLENAFKAAYGAWDTGEQNLWSPQDPPAGP